MKRQEEANFDQIMETNDKASLLKPGLKGRAWVLYIEGTGHSRVVVYTNFYCLKEDQDSTSGGGDPGGRPRFYQTEKESVPTLTGSHCSVALAKAYPRALQ